MRSFHLGTGFKKRSRFLPITQLGALGFMRGLPSLTSLGSGGLGFAGAGNSLTSLTNQLSNVGSLGNVNTGALLGQAAVQAARGTSALFQLALQASNDMFIRQAAAQIYINGLTNAASIFSDIANVKVG